MSDRPRDPGAPAEGTPEYEWLYGRRGNAPDDVTRAIPTQSPKSQTPRAESTSRPDETRVMPAVTRPRRASSADGPPRRPESRSTTGDRPPSRPARSRGRFRLGWLKLVLLLWLVFMIAVPFWAWTKVTKVEALPDGDRPADQPGQTYLLVGSDSRDDLTPEERKELGTGGPEGQRTDTIMLLHTGDGPNLLMSIPRDSIVEIPGHGTDKINAAFAYDGPEGLIRTLEGETGIRIDDYVEVGFGGFVGMVDAVGGIEICPTEAMDDPLANLKIKKGCQEADGKTALGYARSRHTSGLGDIDRAKHQREVVSAIGKEALSPWTFINPVRYYRLNMAAADSFNVSDGTSPISLARFGFAMTRVNGEQGLTCGVPIADLAVNWDEERSRQLFQHIIEDDTAGIPDQLCTPTGMPR
ncbi:LytR family transcriptional regulator [Nocardioides gansuensis]|uniref:LytR family transcriptional regulator n=1 Tax=Nocardioides gansuensis TaxID=2138300 RepID=A0A2T8FBL4_9ACTN|nr:LCP family protein [Nocardioides gansuensis]PVG83083.1 LytR family transcriptional regulator [Nocardioides gansuensis]